MIPSVVSFVDLMKKALHCLIALLCCLQLAGGPLGLLQCYAWGTMLLDYSKQSGWSRAVEDTFGGEKPCDLCRKIESARENSPAPGNPAVPLHAEQAGKILRELLPVAFASLRDPVARLIEPSPPISPVRLLHRSADAPPVPPPRHA